MSSEHHPIMASHRITSMRDLLVSCVLWCRSSLPFLTLIPLTTDIDNLQRSVHHVFHSHHRDCIPLIHPPQHSVHMSVPFFGVCASPVTYMAVPPSLCTCVVCTCPGVTSRPIAYLKLYHLWFLLGVCRHDELLFQFSHNDTRRTNLDITCDSDTCASHVHKPHIHRTATSAC